MTLEEIERELRRIADEFFYDMEDMERDIERLADRIAVHLVKQEIGAD